MSAATTAVRMARGVVAPSPTPAQKEAGNYSKEHLSFQGLPITVENKRGSLRSGIGKGGRHWSVTMPADYGYFKRTEGADGDHVDCYIGPDPHSRLVFIVNQRDADTRRFDEHKVMLGFTSERQAVETYCRGFSDGKGRARIGSIETISVDTLKHWLKSGKTLEHVRADEMIGRCLGIVRRRP